MIKSHYQKVLNQIIEHPETWDQMDWHCDTKHCFAGWAQILSGKKIDIYTVFEDAMKYLDITRVEARYLFSYHRTLQDFINYERILQYNIVVYGKDDTYTIQ